MEEYEHRVREWLKDSGQNELAGKIPFFKDGATLPEKWFDPQNTFRPLFVLKEVSLGVDAILEIHNGASDCSYDKYDFSYKSGGEKYQGDVQGYRDYGYRTANPVYNDIIEKIAVLEIKKIGGGKL